MQSYINHLLEDITNAQKAEDSIAVYEKEEPKSIEEHFNEIERWLEDEEPANTFSYYCGLEKEQFPQAEGLQPHN